MTRFISVQMLYYFYRLWIGIKKLLVLIEMARQVSSKKILLLLDIFLLFLLHQWCYLLTYPLHPRWDTRHPSMVYLLILFIPGGTQGIHQWCYLLTYPLHPRWDTRHPSMVLLTYLSSSSPMGHKASGDQEDVSKLLTYPLHPRWDTRHPSMVYLLTYPLHPRWDTRHPSMVLLTYLSSSSPMGHKASINGVLAYLSSSSPVGHKASINGVLTYLSSSSPMGHKASINGVTYLLILFIPGGTQGIHQWCYLLTYASSSPMGHKASINGVTYLLILFIPGGTQGIHQWCYLLTYPLHPRWDTRHPSMVLLTYLSSSSPVGHKASINGVTYLLILFIPDGTQGIHQWCYLLTYPLHPRWDTRHPSMVLLTYLSSVISDGTQGIHQWCTYLLILFIPDGTQGIHQWCYLLTYPLHPRRDTRHAHEEDK